MSGEEDINKKKKYQDDQTAERCLPPLTYSPSYQLALHNLTYYLIS